MKDDKGKEMMRPRKRRKKGMKRKEKNMHQKFSYL
jgi:hypothetical protein